MINKLIPTINLLTKEVKKNNYVEKVNERIDDEYIAKNTRSSLIVIGGEVYSVPKKKEL